MTHALGWRVMEWAGENVLPWVLVVVMSLLIAILAVFIGFGVREIWRGLRG